jgi:hypothetical protein
VWLGFIDGIRNSWRPMGTCSTLATPFLWGSTPGLAGKTCFALRLRFQSNASVAFATKTRLSHRFPSGNVPLMTSLVAGVSEVITAGYMCVFSCANDHQDVRGETVVMKTILGPTFLLEPVKSPFAACRYDDGCVAPPAY